MTRRKSPPRPSEDRQAVPRTAGLRRQGRLRRKKLLWGVARPPQRNLLQRSLQKAAGRNRRKNRQRNPRAAARKRSAKRSNRSTARLANLAGLSFLDLARTPPFPYAFRHVTSLSSQ